MIVIKYTKIGSDDTPEQSNFEDQAAYDQHKIDHPEMYDDQVYLVEDISVAALPVIKIQNRADIREKCLGVLDEIAVYNEEHAQAVAPLLATSAFLQITVALLAGAPKTAGDAIAAVGPSVYPQILVDSFKAKLYAIAGIS